MLSPIENTEKNKYNGPREKAAHTKNMPSRDIKSKQKKPALIAN